MTARLLITPGEPAGVGPDLLVRIAQTPAPYERIAVADPTLLETRARALGLPLSVQRWHPDVAPAPGAAGTLTVHPVPLAAPVTPGEPTITNAAYVLDTLREAARLCLAGDADALITGPVHKGIINDAGIAFSGHTEWLAELTDTPTVVMMLATEDLRVALATTHLPLRAVPDAIRPDTLTATLRILHRDLQQRFGVADPRILVCGLNPHAGEGGHLGDEEARVITPVLDTLRAEGLHLTGPAPADTAFTPPWLAAHDAVLAMYHDQGLPVLKHHGFGQAVNITLGLPIVRTSVDHGTALDLAGTDRADTGSLAAALTQAWRLTGPA